MRPEAAAAELRRLLPLLSFTGRRTGAATHSVASLVVSTAYSATAARSVTNHSRDCPVLSKKLPLSLIGKESSFAARPCLSCVRERVHYVSSVSFCHYFEKKCAEAQHHQNGASSNGVVGTAALPNLLLEAIERSYGSVNAFKDSVALHSTGAMSPGRLWIVYTPPISGSEHGAVSLLNLPACRVPLVHGLWPLAVINMTEKRLCEQIACRSGKGGDAVDADNAPAWCHAARTPKTLGALATTEEGNDRAGSVAQVRLSSIQSAIAEEALSAMNWKFVEMQLTSALAYYSSKVRKQTQREHRKEREHVAAVRAMSQLKDSGAVIHATDWVTITSSNSFVASPASEPNLSAAAAVTSSSSAKTENSALGEANTQTAAVAVPSAEATVTNTASNSAQPADNTAAGAAAAEPRIVQQADGTWEYHYNNGSVTKAYPDGTKVFQTESWTTTVFVNGDTLFEYPNNTSILDRADGVRVTTYADGTKKEERLK
ncbi:conserved hypothetical protein [Leishmania infantum JPCM5]|uniref:Uncharacterized protein n=3 Tax=Leishmania donovani species complex TaxID=38574 RepID=A4IAP2_LEIIN|nr:conserved hypothetical protein [Leishmania infantum JPCM5]CAC9536725.1 hypothetical_protein_-_conserved [Leishmania infantum]CAM71900.1 conserved hypothetical protein [Leishmania infantum JPCM5]SUZ45439.1 hypothetical_protein_-_conserved [Leishmania infantum]VDZ48251.1 hypothetical_protein_conserved [Leishmania donovani]|eukprot:XP_001468811.1 conserved hypothetical protein [Leishmania infantum JPCM5]